MLEVDGVPTLDDVMGISLVKNAFLRDLWLYMNAIKIYLAIHV